LATEEIFARDRAFDYSGPRSKGGQTTSERAVIACSSCNRRKGDLTPQ